MRSFVDKKGRVLIIGGDHAHYCRYKLKTTLRKYLQSNIRVKQHRDELCIETLQKHITDSQLKAIRKLYKEYRCLELIAGVDYKLYRTIRELPKNKTSEIAVSGRTQELAGNSAGKL